MRDFIRSHLQYKLMLAFSLVLLISLIVTASYNQLRISALLLGQSQAEGLRLVSARAAAAENLLADNGADLIFMSQSSAVLRYMRGARDQGALRALQQSLLSFLSQPSHTYSAICLLDAVGREEICAASKGGRAALLPADQLRDQGRRPDVARALALRNPVGQPAFLLSGTELIPSADRGLPPTAALRYNVILRGDDDGVAGLLSVQATAQPLIDLLVDKDPDTQTFIVDRTGSYILPLPATIRLPARLSDVWPSTAAQIVSRPSGTIIDSPDSQGSFISFIHLESRNHELGPWTLISIQPAEGIHSAIFQTLLINMVLTLFSLIAGVLVAFLLTRSIVRPVTALAAAAERVGAGDLGAPIPTSGRDEIGALAGTFAHTVAQLRHTLERADRGRREAETLRATTMALSSTLDLPRVLEIILQELRAVVPFNSATVQLVQGDATEIIATYGLAHPEQILGISFPLVAGAGPNAEVARTRAPLILDDAPTRYAHFNEAPYRADPIRSWLGVPLIFGERFIGMITVDKYEPRFYTAEHASLAGAFAAQAAIAIEHARLYAAARAELAERRRSEQAQVHLTAILEATTDVVGSADIAGRTMFINRAGRRLLGIPEGADVIGRPVESYVPAYIWERYVREAVPAALRDGAWSGEAVLLRSDGGEIPASQVIIAHRNLDGRPQYFSTIIRDMSDRLRAEERLRQAQKMEAVGRLAGGVSHDFNNILTVIMGECDLLMLEPQLSDALRPGVEQIRAAGVRAAALTRQLLAFSRRQVLQPAVINLNEIIGPVEQMLRRLIGEDVALVTELAPGLGAVRADPSQIEQVIMNLCINGRDAMPGGGELRIVTANVRLGADAAGGLAPGDYVLLAVHDTGLGIDDAARQHIFEPFFTTKPHGKGTGLGLATVHGIVEQSGGTISFASAIGQGTSFFIYLPVVDLASAEPRELPAPARPIAPGTTVLLVEDDERVRRLAQQILARYGLQVIEAADGIVAQRLALEYPGPIDLLLSDIIMPGGINGVQLAARLRAIRPGIKLLLMSGYTDDARIEISQNAHEIHFIQKPFTAASLQAAVATALMVPV